MGSFLYRKISWAPDNLQKWFAPQNVRFLERINLRLVPSNFNLLRIQDIFLKIMDSIKFYALNNQFLMDFYFWKSVFSWISCLGYLNLIGIPFWEMYFLMNFPIRVFEFQWISNFGTRFSIDFWLMEIHFQWISNFGNIHFQSISSTVNCQNP